MRLVSRRARLMMLFGDIFASRSPRSRNTRRERLMFFTDDDLHIEIRVRVRVRGTRMDEEHWELLRQRLSKAAFAFIDEVGGR